MTKPSISLLLVACALALPARGQDAAGKTLLEGLAGYDAKLAGTRHFGFYFKNKRIGDAKLVIGKAPAGSGATYQLVMTIKASFGPETREAKQVLLLDEKLALVSRNETETHRQGKTSRVTVTTVKRDGGSWSLTARRGEQTVGCGAKVEGLDHWESGFPMALELPRKPGSYTLRGLQWPGFKELQGESPQARYQDIKIRVAAAAPHQHRGKTVQAHRIHVSRVGEDDVDLFVSTSGELLELAPVGPPVHFVAGTEAECKQDLPAQAPKGPQPTDPVMVYFKVVFKLLKVDALDAVMDWAAIRTEMGRADLEVPAFAKLLKDQFAKQPAPPGKDSLSLLKEMLVVERKGATARVYIEDSKKDPFHLKQGADKKWRITHFPH